MPRARSSISPRTISVAPNPVAVEDAQQRDAEARKGEETEAVRDQQAGQHDGCRCSHDLRRGEGEHASTSMPRYGTTPRSHVAPRVAVAAINGDPAWLRRCVHRVLPGRPVSCGERGRRAYPRLLVRIVAISGSGCHRSARTRLGGVGGGRYLPLGGNSCLRLRAARPRCELRAGAARGSTRTGSSPVGGPRGGRWAPAPCAAKRALDGRSVDSRPRAENRARSRESFKVLPGMCIEPGHPVLGDVLAPIRREPRDRRKRLRAQPVRGPTMPATGTSTRCLLRPRLAEWQLAKRRRERGHETVVRSFDIPLLQASTRRHSSRTLESRTG